MLTSRDKIQEEIMMYTLEELVPEDHIVRKLDKAIDFSFIRDIVRPLYCEDNGRPSVDPVILFKIIIIKNVFGIKSIRQTIKDIEVNVAYRWFLRLGLKEKVPHFSIISTNYRRRFKGTKIFNQIFERILLEAIKHKFVDVSQVFIDATHVKANANRNKHTKEYIEKSKKEYEEELIEAINEDRKAHGKKPLKDNEKPSETKESKVSKTDPESGVFHKGEKEKCFAYTATTASDKNGFILGNYVTAGNIHDSVSFYPLYRRLMDAPFKDLIGYLCLDAAYKTPHICKTIFNNKQIPIMPYKRPMTKAGHFKKHEYIYDEYYDWYICPNNYTLKYKTTNREGYRLYQSNPNKCKTCPFLHLCTQNKEYKKTIARHVWEEFVEMAEEIRHTEIHRDIYPRRKETIERVFAEGKENHGLRYTRVKGREKVQNEITLIFACMNLKKLALWLDRKTRKLSNFLSFLSFYRLKSA